MEIHMLLDTIEQKTLITLLQKKMEKQMHEQAENFTRFLQERDEVIQRQHAQLHAPSETKDGGGGGRFRTRTPREAQGGGQANRSNDDEEDDDEEEPDNKKHKSLAK